MALRKVAFFLSLVVALAGCATKSTAERGAAYANKQLEQRGSPYRWSSTNFPDGSAVLQRELIGTPCTTAANATLQHDVLTSIGQFEVQNGGSATPELLGTRCISLVRSQVNEAWVIARGKEKMAYTVSFRPQASGGVAFEVHGPWGKAELPTIC
ncbi:MAG: hypothetical protein P4L92_14215 [Rudaea sp.]|nr:hypothetical protein [Rudaea sp.]